MILNKEREENKQKTYRALLNSNNQVKIINCVYLEQLFQNLKDLVSYFH